MGRGPNRKSRAQRECEATTDFFSYGLDPKDMQCTCCHGSYNSKSDRKDRVECDHSQDKPSDKEEDKSDPLKETPQPSNELSIADKTVKSTTQSANAAPFVANKRKQPRPPITGKERNNAPAFRPDPSTAAPQAPFIGPPLPPSLKPKHEANNMIMETKSTDGKPNPRSLDAQVHRIIDKMIEHKLLVSGENNDVMWSTIYMLCTHPNFGLQGIKSPKEIEDIVNRAVANRKDLTLSDKQLEAVEQAIEQVLITADSCPCKDCQSVFAKRWVKGGGRSSIARTIGTRSTTKCTETKQTCSEKNKVGASKNRAQPPPIAEQLRIDYAAMDRTGGSPDDDDNDGRDTNNGCEDERRDEDAWDDQLFKMMLEGARTTDGSKPSTKNPSISMIRPKKVPIPNPQIEKTMKAYWNHLRNLLKDAKYWIKSLLRDPRISLRIMEAIQRDGVHIAAEDIEIIIWSQCAEKNGAVSGTSRKTLSVIDLSKILSDSGGEIRRCLERLLVDYDLNFKANPATWYSDCRWNYAMWNCENLELKMIRDFEAKAKARWYAAGYDHRVGLESPAEIQLQPPTNPSYLGKSRTPIREAQIHTKEARAPPNDDTIETPKLTHARSFANPGVVGPLGSTTNSNVTKVLNEQSSNTRYWMKERGNLTSSTLVNADEKSSISLGPKPASQHKHTAPFKSGPDTPINSQYSRVPETPIVPGRISVEELWVKESALVKKENHAIEIRVLYRERSIDNGYPSLRRLITTELKFWVMQMHKQAEQAGMKKNKAKTKENVNLKNGENLQDEDDEEYERKPEPEDIDLFWNCSSENEKAKKTAKQKFFGSMMSKFEENVFGKDVIEERKKAEKVQTVRARARG